MIYFISFIIVLGIPVFLHELGHFLAAKSVGIKVEKFYVGFDFFNLGIKKKYKDTEYGIGLFPLGGYVKVAGILDENMDLNTKGEDFEFRSKNVFQKVWFLSAGVIMNFILAFFVFSILIFYKGNYTPILNEPIVNEVVNFDFDNDDVFEVVSPANTIGLKKNDRIISINNIPIDTFFDLQMIVSKNPGNEINLEWERRSSETKVEKFNSIIVPIKNDDAEIGMLGITPYFHIFDQDVNFFESINYAVIETISWTKQISFGIWSLITGKMSMDELSGPLGIAQIAGETASSSGGFYKLFMLMAIISINLGLINILPLPVVDGGHVLIAIIEGIIGREIPIKIKHFIQIAGMLLLLFLFIFVFYNDIYKLFNPPLN